MKLIIITAIKEFEATIKKQLKTAEVTSFSFNDVSGYRNNIDAALSSNWFSSESNSTESIVFFAFVKKENVDPLMQSITEFNTQQETFSNIHIAVLNIEQTNLKF
ncbi:hypothetical protein [Flavobacterium sp.]